jgi:hypothetical protein
MQILARLYWLLETKRNSKSGVSWERVTLVYLSFTINYENCPILPLCP